MRIVNVYRGFTLVGYESHSLRQQPFQGHPKTSKEIN